MGQNTVKLGAKELGLITAFAGPFVPEKYIEEVLFEGSRFGAGLDDLQKLRVPGSLPVLTKTPPPHPEGSETLGSKEGVHFTGQFFAKRTRLCPFLSCHVALQLLRVRKLRDLEDR
jgi:hypothetical protein